MIKATTTYTLDEYTVVAFQYASAIDRVTASPFGGYSREGYALKSWLNENCQKYFRIISNYEIAFIASDDAIMCLMKYS